ncbi:MAG TPA: hypothetical protein VER78_06815 [Thermoanaerobaculia bacterium]|nr:hypothetical protein [Thermoanaerobaculia bacterium]
MKSNSPIRLRIRVPGAFLATLFTAGAIAAGAAMPAPVSSEEFFIVSSVDAGKSTMVLKRPTEVTLTMRVTEKTRCRNEEGKPIRFTDLRAGDTIFIVSERDSSGQLVASGIRQGPMTVKELHQRYLRF